MPLQDAAAQEWVATPELTLATPGDGQTYWGSIAAIAASESRFVVLDGRENRLYAFSVQGEPLWVSGRSGGGPGEFSPGTSHVILRDDGSVIVPDLGNRRLVLFGSDGSAAGTAAMTGMNGLPRDWMRLGTGMAALLAPMPASRWGRPPSSVTETTLVAVEASGAASGALLSVPAEEQVARTAEGQLELRLDRPLAFAASDGTRAFLARSHEYAIHVATLSGTRRQITRTVPAVPVTDKDAGRLRAAMAQADVNRPGQPSVEVVLPRNKPVITTLVDGDGAILVGRGDFEAPDGWLRWDYVANGEAVGSFVLPASVTPKFVGPGRLFAIETDSFGAHKLIMYRLQRK